MEKVIKLSKDELVNKLMEIVQNNQFSVKWALRIMMAKTDKKLKKVIKKIDRKIEKKQKKQ